VARKNGRRFRRLDPARFKRRDGTVGGGVEEKGVGGESKDGSVDLKLQRFWQKDSYKGEQGA